MTMFILREINALLWAKSNIKILQEKKKNTWSRGVVPFVQVVECVHVMELVHKDFRFILCKSLKLN